MNEVDLNDDLPQSFEGMGRRLGFRGNTLRDSPLSIPEGKRKEARMEAERVVNYIKKSVFSNAT
jgi:hypothetical protein